MSVWRSTSSWTAVTLVLRTSGERGAALFPLSPGRDRIDIFFACVLLRPYCFVFALDHLEHKGLGKVLVLVAFLVLELDLPEGCHDILRLESVADALGGPVFFFFYFGLHR